MSKIGIILIYTLFCFSNTNAQEISKEQRDEWVSKIKDGAITTFESVATVLYEGKYGLIDSSGSPITQFKYSSVSKFSDGLALVSIGSDYHGNHRAHRLGGKWGFINTEGKEVIPLKYDYAFEFSNGLAKVNVGGKINSEVYSATYYFPSNSLEDVYDGGKWGFVDKTGKEIIPVKYEFDDKFNKGLILGKSESGYVAINQKGKEIISYNYQFVHSLKDSIALVGNENKFGLVDIDGREIVPVKYDNVDHFSEGLALVSKNHKSGFVNKKGEIVIPIKYDSATPFSNGLAKVTLIDSLPIEDSEWFNVRYKIGFINKKGEEVIPIKYSQVGDSFFEGVIPAREFNMANYDNQIQYTLSELRNGKWGLIDTLGTEVTPLKYDAMGNFSDGLVKVNIGGKDTGGRVEGGLWGFIDSSGKEIVPLKYDEVFDFFYGRAEVKLKGETFNIDKTGKRIEK